MAILNLNAIGGWTKKGNNKYIADGAGYVKSTPTEDAFSSFVFDMPKTSEAYRVNSAILTLNFFDVENKNAYSEIMIDTYASPIDYNNFDVVNSILTTQKQHIYDTPQYARDFDILKDACNLSNGIKVHAIFDYINASIRGYASTLKPTVKLDYEYLGGTNKAKVLSYSASVSGNNISFSWQIDKTGVIGDYNQAQYELQYRAIGSSGATTLTGGNENVRQVVVQLGQNYEWRVRLKANIGEWSDFTTWSQVVTGGNFIVSIVEPLNHSTFSTDESIIFKWETNISVTQSYYAILYSYDNINYSILKEANSQSMSTSVSALSFIQGTVYLKCLVSSDIGLKYSLHTQVKILGKPTIEGLSYLGGHYEKDIDISWRGTYQTGYEYQLYSNNTLIKSGVGGAESRFTISANTFNNGILPVVKVRLVNKIDDITLLYSDWRELSLNLEAIQPTVENLSISGSNIDLPISVSWDSTDQQKYVLEVWQGDAKKHEYTGATGKSYEIQASTLTVGLTEFRVKVAYKDRWTQYETFSTSLVETLPSIAILEPDGRIVQRDEPLRIYWTSQNQTSWRLNLGGTQYTGTSEKELTIAGGTLASGRHEMTLEVTLVITGKTKKTSKSVEFIVQGKPPVPTITSGSNFANNRPTFIWDSQDATSYRVQVGVYDSGWLNGAFTTHKIGTYISNGTYAVSVTVKNQFNIESDSARQQITINAVKPGDIALKVYDSYSHNTLKWTATGFDVYYVYRNGLMIGKSYTSEFTDYTCQGESVYKVQGITLDDRYNHSNEVVTHTVLDYPILSIHDDMLEMKYSTSDVELTGSYNPMSTKEYYAGRSKPITRFGEFEESSYNFNYSEFENFNKLLEMVKAKKPILYRSNKHKLWLSFNGLGFTDNHIVMDYSIQAYEIDMQEVVLYD